MRLFLTFGGASAALQAERVLHRAGIPVSVGSPPPGTAGPCGIALVVSAADAERAASALAEAGRRALHAVPRP
jgi:hypothetical protein